MGSRVIRIAIVADTIGRARRLADVLSDDERLEVVEVLAERTAHVGVSIDVLIALNLPASESSGFGVPVVLVSGHRIEFGRNVKAALPLSASASEISAAVQAAAQDLTVLTTEQVHRWIPARQVSEEEIAVEELTARELEVLRMIADGFANKHIAADLGISEHTAKFHVAQILAKLNAGSRTEAVSVGIRRGLLAV